MKKFLEEKFTLTQVGSEPIEDSMFVLCDFTWARFNNAKFYNCVFMDCTFNMASFDTSHFIKCTFKSCELMNADFDKAVFEQCYAYLSTFNHASFGCSQFGFLGTDMCNFINSRFENAEIPAACREIVGEVIRQISSEPDILAFSGLIKTYSEFCWETLIKIGESFLSKSSTEKVIKGLSKYPNFYNLLSRLGDSDVRLLKSV